MRKKWGYPWPSAQEVLSLSQPAVIIVIIGWGLDWFHNSPPRARAEAAAVLLIRPVGSPGLCFDLGWSKLSSKSMILPNLPWGSAPGGSARDQGRIPSHLLAEEKGPLGITQASLCRWRD